MENAPIEFVIPFDIKTRKEAVLRRSWVLYLFAVLYTVFALYTFRYALFYLSYLSAGSLFRMGLVAVLAVMMFAIPHISFYRSVRRTKKMYPDGVPDVKVSFGDSIVGTYAGNRVEYSYDWIVRTKRYRRSYVLELRGKQHLLLPYDSFVKGDLDSLRALLREKCPNLKVIK